LSFFFFQAADGIRDFHVTGVQTCALPIYLRLVEQEAVGQGFLVRLPPARRGADPWVACVDVDQLDDECDAEPAGVAPGHAAAGRSEERRVGKGRRLKRAMVRDKWSRDESM